jgi:hypothetical protein
MHANPAPGDLLKMLFQGSAIPRPLFLPIVFSLGARLENVPLRAFLGNPTKITNALRQLRAPLRCDGLTCYFDPFLEVEALGASLHWASDDGPPQVLWDSHSGSGELPPGLCSPEEVAKHGRVPVAVEVIRRLKSLMRDEVLLTAGITGPFTLAARITQSDTAGTLHPGQLSTDAIEFASAIATQISSALVAAGANVLFIREDLLPPFTPERGQAWMSSLAPAINIIRFYEALPVLFFGPGATHANYARYALQEPAGCIVCLEPAAWAALPNLTLSSLASATAGVAIPLETILHGVSAAEKDISEQIALTPAIVTTAGDVPRTTDAKTLFLVLQRAARQG